MGGLDVISGSGWLLTLMGRHTSSFHSQGTPQDPHPAMRSCPRCVPGSLDPLPSPQGNSTLSVEKDRKRYTLKFNSRKPSQGASYAWGEPAVCRRSAAHLRCVEARPRRQTVRVACALATSQRGHAGSRHEADRIVALRAAGEQQGECGAAVAVAVAGLAGIEGPREWWWWQ